MRKLFILIAIFIAIFITACSSAFPVKFNTDDSLKLLKKGPDYRLYEHKRGLMLLKASENDNDPFSLFNKIKNDKQVTLKSMFDINIRVDEYTKLGFDVKDIKFNEYRPIIIGENNISGIISEIATVEDNKYRELIIFNSKNKGYYLYYVSDLSDDGLYKIVEGISLIGSESDFSEEITADIRIVANLDLGQDKEGRPYTLVYKKKDEIARAANKKLTDNEWLGIVAWIGSNKREIQDATIDVQVETGGKIIKNNYNAFFDLDPKEACEYSLLVPIDKGISKDDINEIINTMRITLRYKEKGIEKSKELK